MIIGIDPGSSSAIATLTNDGEGADVFDIPNKKVRKGKKYRTVIDIPELHKLADGMMSAWFDDVVVCESVHAMPSQGVVSVFGFGQSFGILLGVFTVVSGKPVELVTPQKWKKHFGLIGKDKDASRLLALEYYPHLADKLKLKKNHDRADALLIARWYLETKIT